MSVSPTVGVIGGGIVGLSTAYALTEKGAQVTLFDPNPGEGQSAGESRIFRHQHEDARLIGFAKRSRELWAEWADRLGRQLISEGGSILAGDDSLVRARAKSLERLGIPYRILDRRQQAEAFPQFGPATDLALLDPGGGAIYAAEAVAALCGRIGRGLVAEPAGGCFEEDGHAVVVTGSSIREFDRVVIAAGDDTPALAALVGIKIQTETSWHARLGFPAREGAELPVRCLQDRSGAFGEKVYGAPEPGQGAFAIGLTGADVDLAVSAGGLIEDSTALRSISARLQEYVHEAMPGLSPEPCGYRICRSTSLPSGADDFSLWREGRFVAAAGGNLFKMAPALGVALADAALGEDVPDLWDESSA